MTLPPQSEGRSLACAGLAGHYPDTLHSAQDPDGVLRRWPDDGESAAAAGVHRLEVRVKPDDLPPYLIDPDPVA